MSMGVQKTTAWLTANAPPAVVTYVLNLKEEMKGYRDRAELAERQVRDLTAELKKIKTEARLAEARSKG